jgi:hypothetical protein
VRFTGHAHILNSSQYGKYRPPDADFAENTARARLHYAATAILEEVKEKRRQWTWQYFAERRDDRNAYINLFQKKLMTPLVNSVRLFPPRFADVMTIIVGPFEI